jgi:hypothetical protein
LAAQWAAEQCQLSAAGKPAWQGQGTGAPA